MCDSAAEVAMPPCLFALVSDAGQIVQQGCEPIAALSSLIAEAERAVLLLAAADVTLLRMPAPPLSASRLKAALPHLVEDHLLVAPADCVMVIDNGKHLTGDKLRQIAVVQRDWLTLLEQTFTALGARHLQALPAQLCVPWREDGAVAVMTEYGLETDIALRLSTHAGIGWLAASEQSLPQDIITGLRGVVPQQPMTLYVPAASYTAYSACASDDITVLVDDWAHWIGAIQGERNNGVMDLMAGLNLRTNNVQWRNWRWPLGLVIALLLVNIVSLNLDWWNLRREANALRTGMTNSYRAAYPNETVIIDPIAQARQKITLAERQGGQLDADDFIPLVARFGDAWASLPASKTSAKEAIAGVEYHDHQLFVRFKNAADADAYRSQIKAALEAAQLSLVSTEAAVWKIGQIK
ncbi:general secretion pathway protein GspL [Glaciimonas sp. PCH181]|nr:general secretion pathway protein GspL [Glaciimonas sp. PCH181]